ncbi:MAG TPA: hypothetical protein VJT16_01640 [Streptosporangiaceae bacterium]|nr:hypothetical protein [Streptosporangiaceae bacterium]
MPVVALITWIVTALGGLYLLAIWLIEYDPDFQRAAATRLPVPIVSGHVLFAVGGLVVWLMYLVTDEDIFAYATVAVLAFVATFGLTMAVRWIGVYRSAPLTPRTAVFSGAQRGVAESARDAWTPRESYADDSTQIAFSDQVRPGELAVPPERHFPVSVVIGHGLFATVTIVLVVLTLLGVGGS